MITAKLCRLSVCPCGFPALDERIPIGTEYQLQPIMAEAEWTCGGCGKSMKFNAIYVMHRDGSGEGGWLPANLFEPAN